MKITVLGSGTSQGVPVITCECEVCKSLDFRDKRLRSSIHIQTDELSLVVDTGPDFRQQMLNNQIRQLDAILYTHEHKDHTAGMDDVRSFNFKQKSDMPIYARKQVLAQLRQEFAYVFAEKKYPGTPKISENTITNAPFNIQEVNITPINVMHHKLPVFGFRIGDFTYITDANAIDEKELEKIKGSKILILNALQKKDHLSHFNLDQALVIAQQIGAEQTYFTHISHTMGLHRSVAKELPENIFLAYDGLKLDV